MTGKGLKVAAVLMFIHGFIELMGITALLPASKHFMPEGFAHAPSENIGFFVLLGLLWGVTRWIAGLGVWRTRRWAVIFGMIISVITLQAAVTLNPFGIMDTLLAAPVLILLLRAWFGKTIIA